MQCQRGSVSCCVVRLSVSHTAVFSCLASKCLAAPADTAVIRDSRRWQILLYRGPMSQECSCSMRVVRSRYCMPQSALLPLL